MAKTLTYTITLLLFLINVSEGLSYKKADSIAASNVLRMISMYFNETGLLPSSWKDVEKFTTVELLHPDFEYKTKYGFPEGKIYLNVHGEKYQVIAMGINTGQEGDIINGEETAPGRLLLLYRPESNFVVSRYKEKVLTRLFKEAEHNISNYTGENANWSNKDELVNINHKSSEPNAHIVIDDSDKSSRDKNVLHSQEDTPDPLAKKTWLPQIGIMAFLIIVTAFILIKRRSYR